jgi:hypothetical protein
LAAASLRCSTARRPQRGNSSGDQRQAAEALLADVYNLTSATLHKVDEHELAWIASDRAMAAAERAESLPLIGASTWWLPTDPDPEPSIARQP